MVILIVEDEFLIGWALKLVLHLAGHHAVGPAASADEAMQCAQAEPPELAFVDINIEGDRDGIAVARALTQEHGTSCIFLTANTHRARLGRDAAVGVVTKPYDSEHLLQTVDYVAAIRGGRSRLRRRAIWSCSADLGGFRRKYASKACRVERPHPSPVALARQFGRGPPFDLVLPGYAPDGAISPLKRNGTPSGRPGADDRLGGQARLGLSFRMSVQAAA